MKNNVFLMRSLNEAQRLGNVLCYQPYCKWPVLNLGYKICEYLPEV